MDQGTIVWMEFSVGPGFGKLSRRSEWMLDLSRFVPIAVLAPNIAEEIVEGRQPVDLTSKKLKRIGSLQRKVLSFS